MLKVVDENLRRERASCVHVRVVQSAWIEIPSEEKKSALRTVAIILHTPGKVISTSDEHMLNVARCSSLPAFLANNNSRDQFWQRQY